MPEETVAKITRVFFFLPPTPTTPVFVEGQPGNA